MTVNVPLGIWLAGGKWFYLGGGGWNGGWWYWDFRRVAALPLPSFLQPPDPLLRGLWSLRSYALVAKIKA